MTVILAKIIGPPQILILVAIIIIIIFFSSRSSESKTPPPIAGENQKPKHVTKFINYKKEEEEDVNLDNLDKIIQQNKITKTRTQQTQQPLSAESLTHKITYSSIEEAIIDAVDRKKAIRFSYSKFNGDSSTRTVSEVNYSHDFGDDYISGYCHLRNEDRTFKINRISKIELI